MKATQDLSDRELLELSVQLWAKATKHIEVLNHEHDEMVSWRERVDRWRGGIDTKVKVVGVLSAIATPVATALISRVLGGQ